MNQTQPSILERPDGESIAYHKTEGNSPGVIFCGGFMSDMTGSKATALEEHCRARGQAFLRFDYLGHGQSSGDFAAKGCISRWADDAAAVLTALTDGPQIVVGSSMGGWVSLKLALSHRERVSALVGIAAAPDFTPGMWDGLTPEQQHEVTTNGLVRIHSEYDPAGYVVTKHLLDDGKANFVLTGEAIELDIPVRLLHGMQDPDVPWRRSLEIAEHLRSDDVRIFFSKSGDHRLSEPDDLELLCRTVDELTARLSA
ncbi:MAG: alpha/beta hydrolase [Minwuia sp.]|uniref:alpha/beta hydrolase n=1 Tax=Minwuia sp. TaxID=2493630 RepID=UPI003A86F917